MATIKATAKPNKADDFKYEVLEDYKIAERKNNVTLRLRLIKWNDGEPKYDLRTWKETEDGEKCFKGISFDGEELQALINLFKD